MDYIDRRRLHQYFLNNYKLSKSTKGWLLFTCPFCEGERVGATHLKMGLVKCFKGCFTGDVIEFVQEVESLTHKEAKDLLWSTEPSTLSMDDVQDEERAQVKIRKVAITLPEGFNSILEGTGSMAKRARSYLTNRGFDIKELDAKGFGYCDQHFRSKDFKEQLLKDFYGYIIVPFKEQGKLIYYLGRNFVGNDEFRYKNPPTEFVGVGKSDVIYNEEALHIYKEVFILEGWSDAETIGKRATATLGWAMSPVQKSRYINCSAKRLIFMPDQGEDGSGVQFYKKAIQIGLEFLDSGKKVFVLNPYDKSLNGLGKDANQIGKEPLMNLYNNTQPLTWGTAMNILST